MRQDVGGDTIALSGITAVGTGGAGDGVDVHHWPKRRQRRREGAHTALKGKLVDRAYQNTAFVRASEQVCRRTRRSNQRLLDERMEAERDRLARQLVMGLERRAYVHDI